MNKAILAAFLLSGLLVGCGQKGGTNPPPPPPPPPTDTFTWASTPDKASFSVPKGGESKLTVSVQITDAKTTKVKLSPYIGTSGVQVTPSTITITGSGSAEFTVKDAGIAITKPYFYIYLQGLSANNSTSGQPLKRLDFQWTVQ